MFKFQFRKLDCTKPFYQGSEAFTAREPDPVVEMDIELEAPSILGSLPAGCFPTMGG